MFFEKFIVARLFFLDEIKFRRTRIGSKYALEFGIATGKYVKPSS